MQVLLVLLMIIMVCSMTLSQTAIEPQINADKSSRSRS